MDYNDKAHKAILDKIAQARRDAYAACPRDSNDHLEAAMFFAMLEAVWPAIEELVQAVPQVAPEEIPTDHLTGPVHQDESSALEWINPQPSIDEESELGLSEENHERND
jgi:hypothetical protein